MTLIKSISGIRGTIGGATEEGLNPLAIVKFTAAYATFIRNTTQATTHKIVVGRDARISGNMLKHIVIGTLTGMGFDVTDIDLASTPTTELAVVWENACGGIILTASHNPKEWNALKLLNAQGEFLNSAEGAQVLALAEAGDFIWAEADALGKVTANSTYIDRHILSILQLPLVDAEAIRQAAFRVVVDSINSVGGIIVSRLLQALGVQSGDLVQVNSLANGQFAHNPEPLPENLQDLSAKVKLHRADVGFAVDPDVDRLAIVDEKGNMFGEEYTLVAISDYVLSHTPGDTVTNISSSRALRDVTYGYRHTCHASAVGEVNVVALMKETNAVIGGEGNGGIIYPASHYGRDALVGIALFLTMLTRKEMPVSELRTTYPSYFISKQKMELTPDTDADALFARIKQRFAGNEITEIDGLKIDFPDKWVLLRKSNTEPIIRVYAEALTQSDADELAHAILNA